MEFEDYNWHDNHIHGFKIIEAEDGEGDLELDIDHITEWLPSSEGSFSFKIAPATLIFKGVTNLQISFDYKSCSAAITPPSIHAVNRQHYQYPNGYNSFTWYIEINWPSNGYIKFHAPSFYQILRKEPVIHNGQYLPPTLRT